MAVKEEVRQKLRAIGPLREEAGDGSMSQTSTEISPRRTLFVSHVKFKAVI